MKYIIANEKEETPVELTLRVSSYGHPTVYAKKDGVPEQAIVVFSSPTIAMCCHINPKLGFDLSDDGEVKTR